MSGKRRGGIVSALVRAVSTLLGLHLQHARREASADIGRIVGGVVLLLFGAMFAVLALVLAHLALVGYLEQAARLDRVQALLAVAGGDLLLAVLVALVARARLKKPVLVETRALVRKTVESLSES